MNKEEHHYCEQLLRAQSERNRFSFRRDYVTSKLMTKMEALFVQDLINRVTMPNVPRETVKENGETRCYSLCTETFLVDSLDWDHNIQHRMFTAMQKKEFVLVRHFGMPQRRYVWINIKKIEDDLDKRAASNEDCQKSSNDYSLESSNDDSPIVDEEVRRNKDRRPTRRTTTSGGFFPFDRDCFQKLKEAVVRTCPENIDLSKIRERRWTAGFAKLRRNHSEEEITAVLQDHIDHLTDPWQPVAYCGHTFAAKYDQIKRRMLHRSKPKKTKLVYDHCETIDLGNGRIQKKPVYIEVPEDERPVIN